MSPRRARILVYGDVQDVGYRALVKRWARRLGIKGLVRNLPDGRVEIFCEGDEESIRDFIERIEVKGDPEDPFSAYTEKIEVFWEGEKGYRRPWKKYKNFEIDYGKESVKKITLDSLEAGKFYLWGLAGKYGIIYEKLKNIDESLHNVSKEMVRTREEVVNELKNMPEKLAELLKKHQPKG